MSGTVYRSYPILPFGIVTCTFSPTTFLEIAVYRSLDQLALSWCLERYFLRTVCMPAYKWPKWPDQRTTGPTRGLQTERSFSMIQDFRQSSGAADLSQVSKMLRQLRACLHGGGGPQVGEVTCLGGVKK